MMSVRFSTSSRFTALLISGLLSAPWLVAAGCAGSAPSAASAQAAPTHAADFFPLAKGWRWAYDVTREGQTVLATYVVIDRQGAEAVVQSGGAEIGYFVGDKGIAHQAGHGAGDYELQEPLQKGATWAVENGRATIVATEQSVTVPAGTFAGCLVVEISRQDPPRVTRTTFAPFVGPVIIEQQVVDATGSGSSTRALLRGMTMPGADVFAPPPVR